MQAKNCFDEIAATGNERNSQGRGILKSEDNEITLEVSHLIADAVILALPKVHLRTKQLLPEYSGIYYVLDETNNVWYIGQAKNIRKRWQGKAHHRIYQLEAQKKKHFTIYYEQVSESQLDSVEKQGIEKYHPHLNSSPVKTKKVRPTETLLRESIAAIADFAFLLGVEPPRKEIESQISIDWLAQKKILGLSIIHVCLDLAALQEKFKPESIEEGAAIIKTAFSSRKAYASKWEGFPPVYSFMYRLFVNGYVVEVNYWSRWCPKEEPQGLREYTQTTLAEESMRALTPESLAKIQNQADEKEQSALYLKRLKPYSSDLIKLLFNEPVDSEGAERLLGKISEDYKAGMRGIGSRSRPIKSKLISSEFISIEELLISRGIDLQKYSRGGVITLSGYGDRMGVYIQSFDIGMKIRPVRYITDAINNQNYPVYNLADGVLDNNKTRAASSQFDTVYLLASVEKKAWLLVEEYLKDFARPATQLSNGEGFVEKFYVSARKYIVPAKVNIKLETIGYSAWIPFGLSEEFPTFETAREEISKRLKHSGLPGLKVGFKPETIEK